MGKIELDQFEAIMRDDTIYVDAGDTDVLLKVRPGSEFYDEMLTELRKEGGAGIVNAKFEVGEKDAAVLNFIGVENWLVDVEKIRRSMEARIDGKPVGIMSQANGLSPSKSGTRSLGPAEGSMLVGLFQMIDAIGRD